MLLYEAIVMKRLGDDIDFTKTNLSIVPMSVGIKQRTTHYLIDSVPYRSLMHLFSILLNFGKE